VALAVPAAACSAPRGSAAAIPPKAQTGGRKPTVRRVELPCERNIQAAATFPAGAQLQDILVWYVQHSCRSAVAGSQVLAVKLGTAATSPIGLDQLESWMQESLARAGQAAVFAGGTVLVLDGSPTVIAFAPQSPAPLDERAEPTDAEMKQLCAGVTKLGEGRYSIRADVLERLKTGSVMKSMRFVPAIKNGQPFAMKVYSIRPDSVWARLGLNNGDTIVSINGNSIATPDQALEAYAGLRDASEIAVEIVRRGKMVKQTYTVESTR
jgi:hypothetical protein